MIEKVEGKAWDESLALMRLQCKTVLILFCLFNYFCSFLFSSACLDSSKRYVEKNIFSSSWWGFNRLPFTINVTDLTLSRKQ